MHLIRFFFCVNFGQNSGLRFLWLVLLQQVFWEKAGSDKDQKLQLTHVGGVKRNFWEQFRQGRAEKGTTGNFKVRDLREN